MSALKRPLLGLGFAILAVGAAAAAPAGLKRRVACESASPYVKIRSSWTGDTGPLTYDVPCGYYGRVGINEDVYLGPLPGPLPPPLSRPGVHRHRHRHHQASRS